tara:strand:- start:137 stop:586 length:450 start_codon:yes stop_codon:yes gene_type:complete
MLNQMKQTLSNINNSKYFAGLVMIMLNIGSKYITVNLTKSQESYLRGTIARQLLIFSVIWMGTRDLFVSIGMTAAFFILTQYLFNEQSALCIIPEKLRKYEDLIDDNNDGNITPEEIENAMRLLEKAKKNERKRNHLNQLENFQSRLIY